MTTGAVEQAEIRRILRSTFGFPTFRPLQEEIVGSVLRGQDVFALMPTGGGKSLCYQLPALLMDGMTVVVSPLIALMKDQVDALCALGVAATYINSALDTEEIGRRQQMAVRGEIKLLYVAPERLMTPGFLRMLHALPIALFAIDEAHCISEWGHDFRPEYRELQRLRELFPDVPVAAFTATATPRVQTDIVSQLGIDRGARFRGSFNRSNLYYDVRPKKGAYAQLVDYLRSRPHESGIIYCATRDGTEDLVRRLGADSIRAVAYHAGLPADQRRRRQEAFIKDDVRIIIATIAFGMGIDKPDVRFVVHFDLPKTLENYYQESGRAGRDGERSDCILFFSGGDVFKLRGFAQEKETEEERRVALWQLQQVADWAGGTNCRRRGLLAYFDEPFDGQSDACCDVCTTPGVEDDVTIPAQMLLSCVKRTGERFGAGYVVEVLRGSRNARLLGFGHDKLPTYGIGRDHPDEWWRNLVKDLIQQGYLRQDPDAYNAVRVTPRGHAVLFEDEKVIVRIRVPASRENGPESGQDVQPHEALFDRLRALRKQLADDQGVPPYVIFHDRALRQMAAELPTGTSQLLRIPGVGERKAVNYGDTFLQAIATYVQETGATPRTISPPPSPVRPRLRGELGGTVWETLRLFQEGNSPGQIAQTRGLVRSTVEGHLFEALQAGEQIDLDRLVSPEQYRAIDQALDKLGTDQLKPVLEHLGPDYTYGQLRLVRWARRRPPADSYSNNC